jgi:uncharacterized protein
MRKIIWTILITVISVFCTGILVFVIAGIMPEKQDITPAGYKANQSVYVTMSDGTRIAVRIVLPYDLKKNEKVPAILETTRYGTESRKTFLINALLNLGIGKERNSIFFDMFLRSEYALVRVDARGSGASFGSRKMEWSGEEIHDIDEIIDWITTQPWSNGKVGTYGISYSGNTAELAMISENPALLASAPLYPDFNPIKQSAFPGGILNEVLMNKWSDGNKRLDANETDIINGGIAPVDEDPDGKLLEEALAERNNINILECLQDLTYFDDYLTDEYIMTSLCPYTYKNEIEKSDTPVYVRVGWHDAGTVNGAIERFLTYSNYQELIIGPWSHAGSYFFDPFAEIVTDPEELFMQRDKLEAAQAEDLINFFDIYLKGKSNNTDSFIMYYTLGVGKWKRTGTWPVEGFDAKTIYFDEDNRLSFTKPLNEEGSDIYKVDFTASTGQNNRWFTNVGGGIIAYPDRAEEDKRLLCYTTEPVENDIEITGAPVISLNMSINTVDGAVYVYLEDVAPDGKVTYLTEGQLRLIHRKETNDDLGYTPIGTRHSFKAEDGQSIIPDENMFVRIQMYAISVLIKTGHSIRIAIAGHDSANFKQIPQGEGDVIFNVQRNSILSSYAEIPMKEGG